MGEAHTVLRVSVAPVLLQRLITGIPPLREPTDTIIAGLPEAVTTPVRFAVTHPPLLRIRAAAQAAFPEAVAEAAVWAVVVAEVEAADLAVVAEEDNLTLHINEYENLS